MRKNLNTTSPKAKKALAAVFSNQGGGFLVPFRRFYRLLGAKRLLTLNALTVLAGNLLFPSLDQGLGQAALLETKSVVESPAAAPTRNIRYPVDKIIITQGFRLVHPGLDLDGLTGDPVYPIAKGVVVATQHSLYAYGNAVMVDHGGGYISLYAHLSRIQIGVGAFVTPDSLIGTMGSTGRSSGDHLHLEIHKDGLPVNPVALLPKLQ